MGRGKAAGSVGLSTPFQALSVALVSQLRGLREQLDARTYEALIETLACFVEREKRSLEVQERRRRLRAVS